MKIRLTIKKIFWFLLIFVLTVIGVLLFEMRSTTKVVPVNVYEAYGKWYQQLFSPEPVRSENQQKIIDALKQYKDVRKTNLIWYYVTFTPYDPNSFILDIGARVIDKKEKSIIFEKGEATFTAIAYDYFGTRVWQGSIVTANKADFQEMMKYLNLNKLEILNKDSGDTCIGINNACIYLLNSFPLLYMHPILGSHNSGINFAFVKNFILTQEGKYIPANDLATLYNIGIRQFHMPLYTYYSFLPASQNDCIPSGCGGCDIKYFATLQNDPIDNLSVKQVEPVYMLIPLASKKAVQQVQGYLIPFYRVYLKGESQINGEKYLLDMRLLVPALANNLL